MFDAVRQQAIAWANVDPDLCPQMASLGLNELMPSEYHKMLNHVFSYFSKKIWQVLHGLTWLVGEPDKIMTPTYLWIG